MHTFCHSLHYTLTEHLFSVNETNTFLNTISLTLWPERPIGFFDCVGRMALRKRALPWPGTPWNVCPPRPPALQLGHLPPSPWWHALWLRDLAPLTCSAVSVDTQTGERRGGRGRRGKRATRGRGGGKRKQQKKKTQENNSSSSKQQLVALQSSP